MITLRCSSLGDGMTNTRDQKGMGATSEKAFINSWNNQVLGKFEDTENVQCEKGELLEPEGIQYVAESLGIHCEKYEGPELNNGYITGNPDMIIGDPQLNGSGKVTAVRDLKVSFTSHSHLRKLSDGLDKSNEWQVKGYGILTKAPEGFVDHVALNSPIETIQKLLLKRAYKYNGDTPLWEELQIIKNHCIDKKYYEEVCEKIGRLPKDRNSFAVYKSFVDMPKHLRHFSFPVPFLQDDEKKIIRRVYEGNEYLKKIGLL